MAGGGPIDMGLLVGGFLAAMQRNGLVLRGDVAVTLMTMAIRCLVWALGFSLGLVWSSPHDDGRPVPCLATPTRPLALPPPPRLLVKVSQ